MVCRYFPSRLICAFPNLAPSEPPHIVEGSVDNTSSWRRSQAWRRRSRRYTIVGPATDSAGYIRGIPLYNVSSE